MPQQEICVMLKFQLDTLEGVDEGVKSFYTEKEGKFVLNVDGVPEDKTEDLTKTMKALEAERNNSKTYKQKLAEFEMQKAEGSGDIESIKKQMAEMHSAEVTTISQQLQQAQSQLKTLTIDNVITSAVAKESGITELLKPFISSRTRLNESGKVEVLGDNGEVLVDKSGNNVSIDAYVSSLKANSAFAGAFKGTPHSGGGTTQTSGSVGHKADKTTDQKVRDGLAELRK